jgi:hypothetical protein
MKRNRLNKSKRLKEYIGTLPSLLNPKYEKMFYEKRTKYVDTSDVDKEVLEKLKPLEEALNYVKENTGTYGGRLI